MLGLGRSRGKFFLEEKKGFEQIFSERNKISDFFEKVHSRKEIKNLICIGIGGSRLGPELLNEFQARKHSKLNLNEFLSL